MIYNQGDTFYPSPLVESGDWVTSADWSLYRASDGFFYDFSDSTFKSTGWTTKYQSLTDASPLWIDTIGITLPSSNDQYQILFREDAGDYILGEKFQVRNDLIINRDNLWAKVVESVGSYTAQQVMSILLAEAAGELVAASSTFKTPDGTTTRITGTADSSGNRSSITLTPSA